MTNRSVPENGTVSFALISFDVDGVLPKLSVLGAPKNAVLVDSANGRGSFTWTPAFSQEGNYSLSFIASDGILADTERVLISVGNVNRPPAWMSVGDKILIENRDSGFVVEAVDSDGDSLFISVDSIPAGAQFSDSANGRGSFTWSPAFDQSGIYTPLFIVSDRLLADTERVRIQVRDSNRSPQFAPIPFQPASEGQPLTFGLSADDPDGDSIILSADSLPAGAIFTDSLNGRGGFFWLPAFDQAGAYRPVFVASDSLSITRQGVGIQVLNVNQAFNFSPIGSPQTGEGQLLAFAVSATDPDGDSLFFAADSLPPGAAFTDSLSGRGGFSWLPDFNQAGIYRTLFIATDRQVTDTQIVQIEVLNTDRAPEFAFTANQQVSEGQFLNFGVAAADPDADPLQLSALGLPPGAAFTDSANGRGGFRWLTKVFQAGTYNLIFTARSGALADTQIVSVRVDTALITYTNHVKAILDTRCTPCHFPGGQRCGTECFNTYAGAFQWRDRIRIRVLAGTMPQGAPLPQGKRDTINAWVLRGALQQ